MNRFYWAKLGVGSRRARAFRLKPTPDAEDYEGSYLSPPMNDLRKHQIYHIFSCACCPPYAREELWAYIPSTPETTDLYALLKKGLGSKQPRRVDLIEKGNDGEVYVGYSASIFNAHDPSWEQDLKVFNAKVTEGVRIDPSSSILVRCDISEGYLLQDLLFKGTLEGTTLKNVYEKQMKWGLI